MKSRRFVAMLVLLIASIVLISVLPASADGIAPVSYLPLVRRDATPAPASTFTPTPQPTLTPVPTTPSQPPNPPGGIPWCPGSTGTTRVGAICKDGSSSTATGSGACSKHGGVACWIGR